MKTASFLIIVTLPLVLLLTSLQALVFQDAYYRMQFSRYTIEDATGMEMADLLTTMSQVMDYLKGDRDDMVIVSRVRGEEREIFGEREKEHMMDVRFLFKRGFQVRNVSLGLLLLSLAILVGKGSRRNTARTLVWAAWLPLLTVALFSLVVALDFPRFFTLFHEVFFDNDLWLLDPDREILIQMLPEGFFRDTAFLTAALFILANLLIGLGAFFFLRGRSLQMESVPPRAPGTEG